MDESLGREVANYLREQGWNAVYVEDVGLRGRSDEDVFAYAWRERRMLWTHDRDFLDDSRFPEHRNPGVVVLAGADGDQEAMGTALSVAMRIFAHFPEGWRRTKSTISSTGEMTVRKRHLDTGRMTTTKYRFRRDGDADIWED